MRNWKWTSLALIACALGAGAAEMKQFENKAIGIAVAYPADWFLVDLFEQSKGGIPIPGVVMASRQEGLAKIATLNLSTITNPGAESSLYDPKGAGVVIANMGAAFSDKTPMGFLNDPGLLDQYQGFLFNAGLIEEPVAITIHGMEAARAVVRGENADGVSLTLILNVVAQGEDRAMVNAYYPTAREAEFAPLVQAITDSVAIGTREAYNNAGQAGQMSALAKARPAEAGQPPVLKATFKATLHPDDISMVSWELLLTNPGQEEVRATFTGFDLTLWTGMHTQGTTSAPKPIALKPGESCSLMDVLPPHFGIDYIPDLTAFARQGFERCLAQGSLYFDDAAGFPFNVDFAESALVYLSEPGEKPQAAVCPVIEKVALRIERPAGLAASKVTQMNAFLDVIVRNPNNAHIEVASFHAQCLGTFAMQVRREEGQSKPSLGTYRLWLRDAAVIQGLLTGTTTEAPLTGTVTFFIMARGWSPAVFTVAFEATLPLEQGVGETTEVKQTLKESVAVKERTAEETAPVPVQTTENSVGMKLVAVTPGTFTMGAEKRTPPHQVTLTKGYAIGAYEVTQAQYEAVMGENPSKFIGPNRPVEQVSWDDAQAFCAKLSEKEGVTYRLPTEAEWEYACRAGTESVNYWGAGNSADAAWYAWTFENSEEQTHDVGQKMANAWGLYDMIGNVAEWCADWHGPYDTKPQTDPHGSPTGKMRVLRGASYVAFERNLGSAQRDARAPDTKDSRFGFRVVRETK